MKKVNKKIYKTKKKGAGVKTALKEENDNIINLDKEIIIGMPNKQKKHNNSSKNKKSVKKISNKRTSTKKKKVYTQKEIEQIKKKKKIVLSIIKNFFIVVLIITAIILFMLSPLFAITNIEVRNNERVTDKTIISLSMIQLGQNIFSINKKQIKEYISENPYIENIIISKILPSTIEINIKERKPKFMIEIGGAYAYISDQGYILEINSEKLEIPIILGYITNANDIVPGKRLNIEDLKKFDTVLKIMESADNNGIAELITKINIEDENNYILLLEGEGKTAYIGNASSINTRMLYLKEIIERQKGINGEIFIDKDINTKKAVFREEI